MVETPQKNGWTPSKNFFWNAKRKKSNNNNFDPPKKFFWGDPLQTLFWPRKKLFRIKKNIYKPPLKHFNDTLQKNLLDCILFWTSSQKKDWPSPIFFYFEPLQKKIRSLIKFFFSSWQWWYYPYRPRDSFSPICGIFLVEFLESGHSGAGSNLVLPPGAFTLSLGG